MKRLATISEDGKYRYDLIRRWNNPVQRQVVWVMLNPSVADGTIDDPTIRKCIGFSKRWGFDGLVVVNLFAYRATDPKELLTAEFVRGNGNSGYIKHHIRDHRTKLVVAAWGAFKHGLARYNLESWCKTTGKPLRCLGTTANGSPRHPGRIGYNTELEPFGKYDLRIRQR